MADRLKLTATPSLADFSQYASSPGRRAPATQNSPFLPTQRWPKPSLVLIAPTHVGMARLSGPEWPEMVKTRQRWSPIPVLTVLDVA